MPITMIFGTEEYTMGPHLHAKFGPHWGRRGYTNSRSWELFKNRGFRGYTALSLSFSLPPSPCSLPISLLTLPSARDCHISVIVQATPWTFSRECWIRGLAPCQLTRCQTERRTMHRSNAFSPVHTGNNVRLCRKNRSTCSIRQRCFDIVDVFTGL